MKMSIGESQSGTLIHTWGWGFFGKRERNVISQAEGNQGNAKV